MSRRIAPLLVLAAMLAAGDYAVTPLVSHRERIRSLADAGGTRWASNDGLVRLWDGDRLLWVSRGAALPPKDGIDVAERLVVGQRFVVASSGGATLVVRRGDGGTVARGVFASAAVSPDGEWLALRTPIGLGLQRSERAGTAPGRYWGDAGARAAFSSDGRRAWIAFSDEAQVIDLERQDDDWREVRRRKLPGPQITGLETVALAGGGERLALARQHGAERRFAFRIELLDADGSEAQAVELDASWAELRAAGPGVLAVLRGYGETHLVDAATAAVQTIPPSGIRSVLRAGAGTLYAIERTVRCPLEGGDGTLTGTVVAPVEDADVLGLLPSPDRRLLWTTATHGLVAWDLALLRLHAALPGPAVRPLLPTPVAGIGMWASDREGGRWHLVDLTGQRDLGHVGGAVGILPAFSPDGSMVCFADAQAVRAWRLPGGEAAGELPLPAWERDTVYTQLAFAADGRRLCVARTGDREVVIRGGYESMPPRWAVAAAAVPGLRPLSGGLLAFERAEHDPWRMVVEKLTPPRLVPDGEGWAVDVATYRQRIAADGSPGERAARVEGVGVVNMPQPSTTLAAAEAGPWHARLAAGFDALGLCEVRSAAGGAVRLLSDGDAWAACDDEGFFDGSRSAQRLLTGFVDGRPATLAGIALHGNRPDALLRRLGCEDSALIEAAARPAARRPRPAGAGPAPSLRLMAATGDAAARSLQLEVGDRAQLQAWIDGVPWRTPQPDADGLVTVAVPADGARQIEFAAFDRAGRRSTPVVEPLPGASGPSGRIVAACLGVSRYRDPSLTLRYAAKDALDLRLALGDGEAEARSWTDAEVVAAALPAIADHLATAGRADTVVLTLAGHGLYVREPVERWVFLPWDADPSRPAETGIPWSAFEALFDRCPARRRLVILDTCESGSLDEDAPVVAGLAIPGARGLRRAGVAQQGIGLAAEFRASDRARFVTADLAGGSGAVVVASSRGGEPSFESEADRNGLFTAVLLQALRGAADGVGVPGQVRDGEIGAAELVRYTAAEVARRSGGRQRPTIDRDNPAADIVLPVLPQGE